MWPLYLGNHQLYLICFTFTCSQFADSNLCSLETFNFTVGSSEVLIKCKEKHEWGSRHWRLGFVSCLTFFQIFNQGCNLFNSKSITEKFGCCPLVKDNSCGQLGLTAATMDFNGSPESKQKNTRLYKWFNWLVSFQDRCNQPVCNIYLYLSIHYNMKSTLVTSNSYLNTDYNFD